VNLADLRLEMAGQRVRIAALEGAVARLVGIVSSEAALRAMRQEVRRVHVIDERRALIRALAGFFEPGNTEATARAIERVYARETPPPLGAERYIDELRRVYGRGGPSRRTIRRALTDLPNDGDSARAADNERHLNES
jgi:hypothetical protein